MQNALLIVDFNNRITYKTQQFMNYKLTFQLCLPLVALIFVWLFSKLCDLYILLSFPYELRHYGCIYVPIVGTDSLVPFSYPTPERFSFYVLVAAITVVLELIYANIEEDKLPFKKRSKK